MRALALGAALSTHTWGQPRARRLQISDAVGLMALWVLAAALRLRALPLVMTLADSLGPWWVAARGWPETRPHAPPYGALLALPHALVLPWVNSLWQAEAALLVIHATVAPLGALLAAGLARDRKAGRRAGVAVGALMAFDPGLVDTAISGAEAYGCAAWLGAAALAMRGTGAARTLMTAVAWVAAVHNHPLALAAAPLLGAGGLRRGAAPFTVGLLLLAPQLHTLATAAGMGAVGARPASWVGTGTDSGLPGREAVEAVGKMLWGAARAWAAHGGPAAALIALGAGVGLSHARTRRATACSTLALVGVALLGASLGALRDHHLRVLSLPLAAGWAARPTLGVVLMALLLRPAADPLARPGAWSRPSTLGLTHTMANAAQAALAADLRPPLIDGLGMGGAPAAEPGGLVLDLRLRGWPLTVPTKDSDLMLIVTHPRDHAPPRPAQAQAVWTGPTAALWRLPRAEAAALRAAWPEALAGGAVDGLTLIDPQVDTARAAW